MARSCLLPAIATLLVVGACSEPSSTRMLSNRVTASLSPGNPCNSQASIEYLPNGTRIRLPEASLFVNRTADLSDCGRYTLASVTQAMLDPRIMQVVIEPETDPNAPGSPVSLQRADTVQQLLSHVGFVAGQPPVLIQPATAPSPGAFGIVLTVSSG